jgi:guanylate kinase
MDSLQLMFIISLALNFVLFIILGLLVLLSYRIFFSKASHNIPESEDLEEMKIKSSKILHKAAKQAGRIITQAELAGLRLFAQEKLQTKEIIEDYRKHLTSLEETLTKQFETRVNEADKTYADLISKIENALVQHIRANQDALEKKTMDFITRSQNALQQFMGQVEGQMKTRIDEEMARARNEIETYRQRRMKILDDNIIEILEKTIQISLGKKLSLTDQSDLIYKALDDAKKEHALE